MRSYKNFSWHFRYLSTEVIVCGFTRSNLHHAKGLGCFTCGCDIMTREGRSPSGYSWKPVKPFLWIASSNLKQERIKTLLLEVIFSLQYIIENVAHLHKSSTVVLRSSRYRLWLCCLSRLLYNWGNETRRWAVLQFEKCWIILNLMSFRVIERLKIICEKLYFRFELFVSTIETYLNVHV